MDEDEINALLDETNQHQPIADLLDEEWDEYDEWATWNEF